MHDQLCQNLIKRNKHQFCIKADLHSPNFSRMNDTLCWRILSFQTLFKQNDIWIICKATCFKQKVNHKKKRRKLKNFDFRSSHQRGFLYKKAFLKNSQISQENICSGVSFDKVADFSSPATLLKSDSNTGSFLRNLQNFKNTYFEKLLNDRLLL